MTTDKFIRRLEKDLGQRIETPAPPLQFPDLPGTAPEACLLPNFTSAFEYAASYGHLSLFDDDRATLEMAKELMDEAGDVLDTFFANARDRIAQDVINEAHATLRYFDRLEQRLAPLLAGMSFRTYGALKSACVGARTQIGNVLDQKALAGEL